MAWRGIFFFLLASCGLSGAQSATWSLTPSTDGFVWQSPSGAKVKKYVAASMTTRSLLVYRGQFTDAVPSKYPDWQTWATQQAERLTSWGFTAAGIYSWDMYASAKMPVNVGVQVGAHAIRDDGRYYHCKAINHNYNGMVCASPYLPPGGGQPDAFDKSCASGKGIAGAFLEELSDSGASGIHRGRNGMGPVANMMAVTTEEGDTLFGLNKLSHPDLGHTILNHNPMMKRSSSQYVYPNATLDAKIALRDWLAARYGCSSPRGGIGTPAKEGDDLHGPEHFCGTEVAERALAALNGAWHTTYTTWSTSDSSGEGGIARGAYQSYGVGSGFLDENGKNTIAAAYQTSCNLNGGLLPTNAWTKTAQIENDLHEFVAYFAKVYAEKLAAAWEAAKPHPPIVMPLYNAPDYVYEAMAPYFDAFMVTPVIRDGNPSEADLKRIVSATSKAGGRSIPLIVVTFDGANLDSPFSDRRCPGQLVVCYPTQNARGEAIAAWWKKVLDVRDGNGKQVVVGIEHWPYYDQANEHWSGGLVSSRSDNPYDGSARIEQNIASCQRNSKYSAPILCHDTNGAYQALSGRVTECVTAANVPQWARKNGSTTRDGTCTWRNEGRFRWQPESSPIADSAAHPREGYGDVVTPLADFLHEYFGDTSTSSTEHKK